MLLKYGRPVTKCDPWIHRATQGPTTDGPFGDQLILWVLQKIFQNETGHKIHWYICVSVCTCASAKHGFRVTHFGHFIWFHALSRLLIDGPTTTETDHPTINHGWSVVRPRILHFPQHWTNVGPIIETTVLFSVILVALALAFKGNESYERLNPLYWWLHTRVYCPLRQCTRFIMYILDISR